MLNVNVATARAADLPESPYRGIESFRFVDRPIFFARDEETSRLLRYVSVYRGVLFYGESGCGKSSLINAGFIPAIIAEGFTPDRLRVQPKPGEEIVVERISTQDTGEPPYLPSNFIGSEDSSARIVLAADKVKERLRQMLTSSPARRPILIFDQFEEFTTLFEEAPRGGGLESAKQAQQAILDLIMDLQRDTTLPVKLLFSFREDYLAKLSKLVALWPDLSDQSQRLTPPGIDALPRIIRGSFEKYPGSFGKELTPALTNELSAAIQQRNEGGKLNLSEVQIACLQLWKSDDPETLFKEKGVQGLLEEYLSDSINRLPADLADPAIALLSRMVTPSGTRNIVSEYDLISQVQEDEGISEERLKNALKALVQDTKLVRRERRYDTHFYDIVSEFLVPWIRRQKVERLANLERQKLMAVYRSRRKRAFIVAAASLLIVIALGIAAIYYIRFQRQSGYLKILQAEEVQRARDAEAEARKDELIARENEKNAQQLKDYAIYQQQQAESAKKTAEEAKVKAETEVGKLNQQVDKLQGESNRLIQQSADAVNRANDQAGRQAMEVYTSLKEVSSKINDTCNKLNDWLRASSTYQFNRSEDYSLRGAYDQCTRAKSQLTSASSALRKIGAGQETR